MIGFTETETTGSIRADQGDGAVLFGYAAMHKLCADEVAPNARAAFSAEAIRSPLLPNMGDKAWITPSSIASVFVADSTDDQTDWVAVDIVTGMVGPVARIPNVANSIMTCGGYRSNVDFLQGTIWNTGSGEFAGELPEFVGSACSLSHPVACSAPVSVAVSVYSE